MTVKEIITDLKKCNQERGIMVFDDESRPFEIDHIFIDTDGDGELSCIVLKPIAIQLG